MSDTTPEALAARLDALEHRADKLETRYDQMDDRIDKAEIAADEWKGLKRWGIGLVAAAVLGSGGAAKLVSLMNQAPAPAAAGTGGNP